MMQQLIKRRIPTLNITNIISSIIYSIEILKKWLFRAMKLNFNLINWRKYNFSQNFEKYHNYIKLSRSEKTYFIVEEKFVLHS
jgi:hypothetical protein